MSTSINSEPGEECAVKHVDWGMDWANVTFPVMDLWAFKKRTAWRERSLMGSNNVLMMAFEVLAGNCCFCPWWRLPRQVIASEWLGETGNSAPWATSGIRQCLLEEGHCSDRWGQRNRGVRPSGKVKSGEQEGFRRDWIQVLYLLPPSNRWQ